ncbi:MAG: tetratricopeptide repeat protein [Acidobacteria bacterium]|nr:tetratricopeptide repeat protein [Acidobacteriota bacterium]
MRSLARSITTLLVLALPSIALAQGGRLAGRVTDEAGKGLADVEAKLIAVETGAEVSKRTNRKGRFSVAVVHPEYDYEIVLSKEGYVTLRAPVKLKRGEPVQGSWVMVPGSAIGGVPGLDLSPEEFAAKQLAVALYNEGAQAFNADDLETAAAKFDAAIAEDPELEEAYVIAAAINWRLERYERALELTDFTLAAEASDARALGVRYDSLEALDRQAEADAVLDYLIANAPEVDTAKRAYNRGLAHAKAADVESAIPRLEQAVAISPDLAAAWGLLGDLEIARSNFQRAIECGDRLLEIEGSRERGLSLRHRAFEALGDEAGVAESLRALAEIDPDAVMNSLFERANDLFDHNEPDAAAKIYRQVLDLQPDNARAHYKLGLALLSAEDTSAARGHLERFLELAPDDPEAPAARDMLTYLQ